MIHLVQQEDYADYAPLLNDMFRLRATVFNERLGWDVKVHDGMEKDIFDDQDPLYVLSLDANGQLRGSLRLLPTTGPNMLADVFNCLLPPGETVRSPLIWESSRFCVSAEAASAKARGVLNETTGELLAALCEVGMLAGLQSIVTVYDARVKRLVRHAGCEGEILGEPQKIGKVTAYAGLFPTEQELLDRIRMAAGISGSVIARAPEQFHLAA